MTDVKLRSDHAAPEDDDGSIVRITRRATARPPVAVSGSSRYSLRWRRSRIAVPLGWATWDAYMGAPWTRDGTVRVHVVTMASEVAGRIVELPVVDNQFVHKGDLLMVIDPTNYRLAVSLAEAAAQQARIVEQNLQLEAKRRLELNNSAVSVEQQQTYEFAGAGCRGAVSTGRGQFEPGAGQSLAYANPLPGQRMGDKPDSAVRRLCECRAE